MSIRVENGFEMLLGELRRPPGGLVIDVQAVKYYGVLLCSCAPDNYKDIPEIKKVHSVGSGYRLIGIMHKPDDEKAGIDINNQASYQSAMSCKGELCTDISLYKVPVRSMSLCFKPAGRY